MGSSYPPEIARELLMQDADPAAAELPPFVCYCGFESSSDRLIKRHVKGCREYNATPAEREAWYRARDEEASAFMLEEVLAMDAAALLEPCSCDPLWDYTCDGCRARGRRAEGSR